MNPGVDAFIIFNEKILLILRDDISGIPNPNMWNLPGGGIEKDESEEQALLRELKEEVNLSPQNIQFIDKTLYEDGNNVSKFLVILDEDEYKQIKLGEGQKFDFFYFEELFSLNIIPNLLSYIQLNKEQLQNLFKEV